MKSPKLTIRAMISVIALLAIAVFSNNEEDFITFVKSDFQNDLKVSSVIVKKKNTIKKVQVPKSNIRIVEEPQGQKDNNTDEEVNADSQMKNYKELFSRKFNRFEYREFVKNGAKSRGSDFALKVSDQLHALEEMQSSRIIKVTHVAGFYRDCATEYPTELPSFVQALCLRRLEQYSHFRQGARPDLETAKRNSHPAVQELFGILSKQDE